MEQKQGTVSHRVPVTALVMAALAALVTNSILLTDLLIYKRHGILEGEVWRIATGPLVHFSNSHLFWDAMVLLIAAWFISCFRLRGFIPLCLLCMICPSLWLLFTMPDLQFFGGLSAVATGAVAFLSLKMMFHPQNRNAVWGLLFLLVLGKLWLEATGGFTLFATIDASNVKLIPSVHTAGVICAVVVAVFSGPPATQA